VALENLRARLANPVPLMQAVGVYLVGAAQRAFKNQGRGGEAWADRSVPNRFGILADLQAGKQPPERRWDARPAGVDTGRLRSSIDYRVEGMRVIVGSRLSYASDVQLGGARQVELTPELRSALAAWLRKLSGAAKRARKGSYPAKEARYQAARASFGPLFHSGVLTADVPARPYLMITDEDRQRIRGLVTDWLGARRIV
jgi:phage gpG-like protein